MCGRPTWVLVGGRREKMEEKKWKGGEGGWLCGEVVEEKWVRESGKKMRAKNGKRRRE